MQTQPQNNGNAYRGGNGQAAAYRDPFLDKGLPYHEESERSVLGSILFDNAVIDQAAEMLKRDHFFFDSHRRIYDKMLNLSRANEPIDLATLSNALQTSNEFEQVGGATYISSL